MKLLKLMIALFPALLQLIQALCDHYDCDEKKADPASAPHAP
jgi:hypothetical protein